MARAVGSLIARNSTGTIIFLIKTRSDAKHGRIEKGAVRTAGVILFMGALERRVSKQGNLSRKSEVAAKSRPGPVKNNTIPLSGGPVEMWGLYSVETKAVVPRTGSTIEK